MLLTGSTLPNYQVSEYLLLLHPHEDLANKIMQIKKKFFDAYKAPSALTGKPHVSLVRFFQYDMMEPRIINQLKKTARSYHPLKIELKDYGSFPTHTIYLQITSKMPLQNLVKEIRQSTQGLLKLNKDNKPHFILEPHLTIARKLLPWQYEKGWLAYRHDSFTGRFIATNMLLLKKPMNAKTWQTAHQFEFMNFTEPITQGSLF